MILQATRRIAQDMSFGRTIVLEKLNVVEILAKAKRQMESLRAEHATAVEQVREQGEATGYRLGQDAERRAREMKDRQLADRIARMTVRAFEIVLLLVLIAAALLPPINLSDWHPLLAWTVRILLFVVAILGALDLLGKSPVSRVLDSFRRKVSKAVLSVLGSSGA